MRIDRIEINSSIEEAVEKTLLYYKMYNVGIRMESLHPFLLDVKATKEELDKAVESLIGKKIIFLSDGILYLDKKIESFYVRKNKTIKKKTAKKLLSFLKRVPFISAIAFSGGTANYGIDNHEDIDLFIIAKPYSAYIVYCIIHIVSLVFKSRDILCPNYLIDETAIEIKLQRDFFTAQQILALKPFKNENYLRYFLNSNNWVKLYYPNFYVPEVNLSNGTVVYQMIRPLNYILFLLYKFRYRKYLPQIEAGSIVLGENIIKLHTNDYRFKVVTEFKRLWISYMNEKNNAILSASVCENGK